MVSIRCRARRRAKGLKLQVQVEDVHDLILCAALYRPANTRGRPPALSYNHRRRGSEIVEYPHEVPEKILGPTLGLSIFSGAGQWKFVYEVGGDDALCVDDVYQGIKKGKGAGRGAKEIFDELELRMMLIGTSKSRLLRGDRE